VNPLEGFAEEVGASGPVAVEGGRTQWSLGGPADPEARLVRAPCGVVSHEPAEMIVRVRAGTPLVELRAATAEAGQFAALEAAQPALATVGGVLAGGRSGVRRLGWGPVRDAVLEVTAVDAGGSLVRAGAPLVKNVTGFDLCRLLVGSLGTLALLAEVVLRCKPLPEVERWWRAEGADPFGIAEELYRPLSVLWDGRSTWVGLAGYGADVDAQERRVLRPHAFEEVAGPPALPGGGRWSYPPAALVGLPGGARSPWLAEVGVGVVHTAGGNPPLGAASDAHLSAAPAVAAIHRRLKEAFDPSGRLNPWRSPLHPAPSGEGR
jgi:hypothetical protein